jgi:hypothetical protein
MYVASLEVCKDLYKLSAWEGTEFDYAREWDKPASHPDCRLVLPAYYLIGHNEHREFGTKIERIPAYDLGYLLRKLPIEFEDFWLELTSAGQNWYAGYWSGLTQNYWVIGKTRMAIEANTPEDAACKLAIELFKQGALTKDGDA